MVFCTKRTKNFRSKIKINLSKQKNNHIFGLTFNKNLIENGKIQRQLNGLFPSNP